MNAFNQMIEVVRKELTHVVRDRRTVVSTQLYALLGPVLLVATISAMSGDPDRASKVGVVGSAPALVHELELAGMEIESLDRPPLDPDVMKPLDVVLAIPDDYQRTRESHRPVALELFVGKGADAKRAERRVRAVIGSYTGRLSSTELIRRGVAPAVTQPLSVRSIDLSDSSKTGLFATLLLMYIVLAPFLAGTGAAIDSATGERERGTLALMRLQPISPLAWVTGKWLVIVAFAWAGAIVTTVISVLAVRQFAPSIASSLALTPGNVALLCLAALPVALVASAVNFGLALQAKSTMEAQTRLTLSTLVPVGLGLLTTAGSAPEGWAVPVLHELTTLADWLAGAAFPMAQAGLNALISVAVVGAVLYWGSRRIVSEEYWVA